jgi:hypothetical protein
MVADGHVTCNIQCLNGRCDRRVDVRLDTLPQDQPWARVGLRLVCSACGAAGSVHIVPNWHDQSRASQAKRGLEVLIPAMKHVTERPFAVSASGAAHQLSSRSATFSRR